jgi:uncharacterized protein YjiS (DUF1127 family)|tara:strand:- start:358 stop:648 length:291 start_codon:yes stop_codon:yes gene_type:complete
MMTTFIKNSALNMSQNLDHAQYILFQLVLQWIQIQALKIAVTRERKQLLLLSDASLRDIGISRSEANIEALSIDIPMIRLDQIKKKHNRKKCVVTI